MMEELVGLRKAVDVLEALIDEHQKEQREDVRLSYAWSDVSRNPAHFLMRVQARLRTRLSMAELSVLFPRQAVRSAA